MFINEYNFDFEGSESWMLLTLLAMDSSMSNPEPPSDIPPCCTPYLIGDGQSFMPKEKDDDAKDIDDYKRELEEIKKEIKKELKKT